jgi:hypothetical protein
MAINARAWEGMAIDTHAWFGVLSLLDEIIES